MSTWPVCVDASIIVDRLLRRQDEALNRQWREWQRSRTRLLAPRLLYYEVTNVIHQRTVAGEITVEESQKTIRALLAQPIELFNDADLHLSALALARELSLSATYDAHYLALAYKTDAELWTRDRSLARAAQQKYAWVHLLPQ
jgi:predicted nucleic acid-binding protein